MWRVQTGLSTSKGEHPDRSIYCEVVLLWDSLYCMDFSLKGPWKKHLSEVCSRNSYTRSRSNWFVLNLWTLWLVSGWWGKSQNQAEDPHQGKGTGSTGEPLGTTFMVTMSHFPTAVSPQLFLSYCVFLKAAFRTRQGTEMEVYSLHRWPLSPVFVVTGTNKYFQLKLICRDSANQSPSWHTIFWDL